MDKQNDAREAARRAYVTEAGIDLAEALRRAETDGQVKAFNRGFDAGWAAHAAAVAQQPDENGLLPCSACGDSAKPMSWMDLSMSSMDDRQHYYVECSLCGLRTPDWSTRNKAIAAWNNRRTAA